MIMAASLGTGSAPCPPTGCKHPPVCRCGATVTEDDVVVTASGRYPICPKCWERGRRGWFRPDSKAERIAAVERAVARG
jgi:hypothetical protein